jgi:hypothetical protein
MLVVPMRSKFLEVMPRDAVDLDPHTFPVDRGLTSRFDSWRSALLDVLVERFDPEAFAEPLDSMLEWRRELTTNVNPLALWMSVVLSVTKDKKDYVQLADLEKRYRETVPDSRVKLNVSEFALHARAYLIAVAINFKDKDNAIGNGARACRGQVAKGVLLRPAELSMDWL